MVLRVGRINILSARTLGHPLPSEHFDNQNPAARGHVSPMCETTVHSPSAVSRLLAIELTHGGTLGEWDVFGEEYYTLRSIA